MVKLNFSPKDLGIEFFFFLGIEVTRSSNVMYLTQIKYAQDLFVKTKMEDTKRCATSMSSGKHMPIEDGDVLVNPQ